jgi:hypothetical protein
MVGGSATDRGWALNIYNEQRFGKLVVVSTQPGMKNRHPMAVCKCDCGRTRTVRQTTLRRGHVTGCANCSLKQAWVRRPRRPESIRILAERESAYRCNARRKRLVWQLSSEEFSELVHAACRYCGLVPAKGVDRLVNADGYTTENAVPCCTICNLAKRDMAEREFVEWILRAHAHITASERFTTTATSEPASG